MRSSRVHWGLAGIGVALGLAALAPLSILARAGLIAFGVTFILFALRWPQALATIAIKSVNGIVRKARTDQDAVAAIRLCQEAARNISALPTRETGESSWTGVLSSLVAGLGQSDATAIYLRRHRAATVNAVRVALRAGARDDGALQLAEAPHGDADLLGLKAELLRIVLELSE